MSEPAVGPDLPTAGASPDDPVVGRSADALSTRQAPDAPPRAIAARLWVGALLVLVGALLLVAAVHENLVATVWATAGGPPQTCDDAGVCVADTDVSPTLLLGAVVALVPGAWLLLTALRELGRRSDDAVGARSHPLW